LRSSLRYTGGMTVSRRSFLAALPCVVIGAGLARAASGARPTITVYKSPT